MAEFDYSKVRAYSLSTKGMHFLYDTESGEPDCRKFPGSKEKILIGIPKESGESGKIILEDAVELDLGALRLLRDVSRVGLENPDYAGTELLREFYLEFFEDRPDLLGRIKFDKESDFGCVELWSDVGFINL